jgi:small multidrug resistance pump
MVYLMLGGAILAEVLGTTAMKYSDGYLIAFALLAQTLRTMSVGTAYAIWAGVGTAVIAGIGMVFLGESASAVKLAGLALVIAGVVVLNLGGAH